MEIVKFLSEYVTRTTSEGPFNLGELLIFAEKGWKYGIGMSTVGDVSIFVIFVHGEPQGAVEIDPRGALFGDKAVLLIRGNEQYRFFAVDTDTIEQIVLGCRVFDRSHISRHLTPVIPHIVKRSEGVGPLSITITRRGTPVPGLHITIRKKGQVVGDCVTTGDGKALFKLLFGVYECVIMDHDYRIRTFPLEFTSSGSEKRIELEAW